MSDYWCYKCGQRTSTLGHTAKQCDGSDNPPSRWKNSQTIPDFAKIAILETENYHLDKEVKFLRARLAEAQTVPDLIESYNL